MHDNVFGEMNPMVEVREKARAECNQGADEEITPEELIANEITFMEMMFNEKVTVREDLSEEEKEKYVSIVVVALHPNILREVVTNFKLEGIFKFPHGYPKTTLEVDIRDKGSPLTPETLHLIHKRAMEAGSNYSGRDMAMHTCESIFYSLNAFVRFGHLSEQELTDERAELPPEEESDDVRRQRQEQCLRLSSQSFDVEHFTTESVSYRGDDELRSVHYKNEIITLQNHARENQYVIDDSLDSLFGTRYHSVFSCRKQQDRPENFCAKLYCWIFRYNASDRTFIYEHIEKIMEEFPQLLSYNSKYVERYVGYKIDEVDNAFHVNIMIEASQYQMPIASYISGIDLRLTKLRTLAKNLLEALSSLHNSSIIHRNLQPSNVMICVDGDVKLSEFSIVKRLDELSFIVIRNAPMRDIIGNRRTDCFELGKLISMLAFGSGSDQKRRAHPIVNNYVTTFIGRCFAYDTCDVLLKHPFITVPDDMLDEKIQNMMPESWIRRRQFARRNTINVESRFERDYRFEKKIGSGGFGQVWLATNKDDLQQYALKVVKINSKECKGADASKQYQKYYRKILREAELLSLLKHKNIVRYFCTWTEAFMPSIPQAEGMSGDEGDDEDESGSESNSQMSAVSKSDPSSSLESKKNQTSPRRSKRSSGSRRSSDSDDSSDITRPFKSIGQCSFIDFKDNTAGDAEKIPESSNFKETESCDEGEDKKDEGKVSETMEFSRVLFIQMEYCAHFSLREYIDRGGLWEKHSLVWMLFHQIIDALAYMHRMNVVHRDLKPSNIFLDNDTNIRIGDFGLAYVMSPVQPLHANPDYPNPLTGGQSEQVGTELYMAPETLAKLPISNPEKIDMYSLGIILYEMFNRFTTGMERIVSLKAIRTADFDWPDKDPDTFEYKMVEMLLNHDPQKRTTASYILDNRSALFPLVHMHKQMLEEYRNALQDKSSAVFSQMMEELFKRKNLTHLSRMYEQSDVRIEKSEKSPIEMIHFLELFDRFQLTITQMFLRHGGWHMKTSLLVPLDPGDAEYENMRRLQFVDINGNILCLPVELWYRLGRRAVQHELCDIKLFELSNTFREPSTVAHPFSIPEAVFTHFFNSESLLPEFELISMLDEIVHEHIKIKDTELTLSLTHSSLLPFLLELFQVPDLTTCMRLISNAAAQEEPQRSLEVFLKTAKIKTDTFQPLFNIMNATDDIGIIQRIRDTITKRKKEVDPEMTEILLDLEAFASLVAVASPRFKVMLGIGMPSPQNACGITFRLNRQKPTKKSIQALAMGGRFDHLIKRARQCLGVGVEDPKSGPKYAVGLTLAMNKLFGVANKESLKSKTSFNLEPADITIVTPTQDKRFNADMARMLRSLWTNRVPCDMIIRKNLNNQRSVVIDTELGEGDTVCSVQAPRGSDIPVGLLHRPVKSIEICDYLISRQHDADNPPPEPIRPAPSLRVYHSTQPDEPHWRIEDGMGIDKKVIEKVRWKLPSILRLFAKNLFVDVILIEDVSMESAHQLTVTVPKVLRSIIDHIADKPHIPATYDDLKIQEMWEHEVIGRARAKANTGNQQPEKRNSLYGLEKLCNLVLKTWKNSRLHIFGRHSSSEHGANHNAAVSSSGAITMKHLLYPDRMVPFVLYFCRDENFLVVYVPV